MKSTLRVLAAVVALVMAGFLGMATRTHAQTLTTGTISGTVTDPSGKSLSGVQITIVQTGQTDVTNASGYFVITDVLPGTHSVRAELVGFEPVTVENVNVTQELTTNVSLQLRTRQTIQTGTQTVIAPLIRPTVTPTLYTVTSREEQLVRSQPNNLYQYPGALISQPGIVPDADGYPTVRGSRITEVGYMVDGILIVEPSSGGFATNLVTVGMDRMNVYTGGYRAELGSSIGGIINAVIKTGASMRGQAAVEAGTGSWGFSNLVYEQGDVERNGFNWYVSGNFFRTRFEQNRQVSELPASADAVVKLIQPIGNRDRLTLMYTGGFERYHFPEVDPFTGEPWGGAYRARHGFYFDDTSGTYRPTTSQQDYADQMHHIGSLTWSHRLSNTTSLSVQGYAWDRRLDDHELSDWSGFESKYRDKVYATKADLSSQFSERLQFRVGGEMIEGKNYNRVLFYGVPGWEGLPPQRYVRDADTTDLNGYLSATLRPADPLVLDLGLRYDSRTYHRQIRPEDIALGRPDYQAADLDALERTGRDPKYSKVTPRVGATLRLTSNTLLKASAGQFVQFAPANYLERIYIPTADFEGNQYANEDTYEYVRRKVFDVRPEYVDSYDVGIETQITRNIGLALTPFWRKTHDMFDYGPVFDDAGNRLPGSAFANMARGRTTGVETKLQFRERAGLSGWITYTYQRARANTTGSVPGAGLADPSRPDKLHRLDYDQEHTLYLVGQYRTGRFEFNPLLELGSGYAFGNGEQFVSTRVGTDENGDPVMENLPILVDGRLAAPEINTYNTGWHSNLNVTFRLYNNKERSSYYFLQVQNILNSEDVTARSYFDPGTGATSYGRITEPVTYINENGEQVTNAFGGYEYRPTTRVAPIFVLVGLRQTF